MCGVDDHIEAGDGVHSHSILEFEQVKAMEIDKSSSGGREHFFNPDARVWNL